MGTHRNDKGPVAVEFDGRGSVASRVILLIVRVGVALMWIENAGWKRPPDFSALRKYTTYAVDYPVFAPFSRFIDGIVLPNFAVFGWFVLVLESCLGAFLLIGLATRFWAVIGILQSLAIALSVLQAPHEWEWSYYLMVLIHLGLFATAAGRAYGLDALLRPGWQLSMSVPARVLLKVS